MSLYDIARQVTDEVLGDGAYAEVNKNHPDPGVQRAIENARPSTPGLQVPCTRCDELLTEPGALLFSPPKAGAVFKHHLCVPCYKDVAASIGAHNDER